MKNASLIQVTGDDGLGFIAHAYLKYAIFTPAGTVQYFQSLGLPGPLAYVVMAAEFFGGIALILGLWTRWVSLALLPIMLGAIFAHSGNGFFFTAANGGWEFPAFWTVMLVVQALLGDDWFPYGLKRNYKPLDTFLRYHYEQGLSKRRFKPEDLFLPETLND